MSNIATLNRNGRKKGSSNRFTRDLRAAILAAAEAAGGDKGAQGYLERQAVENPVAFMTLLGKCLPVQVAAKVATEMTVTSRIILDSLSPDQLDALEMALRSTVYQLAALEAPTIEGEAVN